MGQLRLGLGQILHYGGWAWWLWLLCASSWNPLSSCRSGALETRDGLGRRSVELSGLVSRPSTGSTVVGVCFAGASKVFERFRRGAREAVKLAQEHARSLGHNYIEPSTCFWGY